MGAAARHYNTFMCASTVARVLRGVLSGAMFFIAGEKFLTVGFTVPALLLVLLGGVLFWQALTGGG